MARHVCASPHPIDVYVGKQIRGGRILRGLSQSALAQEIGVTFQQLQKYERGYNRVCASKLYGIAVFLKLPLQFFFPEPERTEVKVLPRPRRTLQLVRYFEAIPDEAIRQQIFHFTKAVSKAAAPARQRDDPTEAV
jgi:transcriptional regulator with XRE-family HTH domain